MSLHDTSVALWIHNNANCYGFKDRCMMAHMVKMLGWRLATLRSSPCCHGAEWAPVPRSSSCWRHERTLQQGIHREVVISLANPFNPETPWCFWHKCNAVASKENIPQPEKSPISVLGAIFTLIQLQGGLLMEICLFHCVPQFQFLFPHLENSEGQSCFMAHNPPFLETCSINIIKTPLA